jgi:hypothetical protein
MAEKGKALSATGRGACTRHGLSVFKDFQACALHRQLFPYLGDWIATAELEPVHGRIALTANHNSPEHHTWWPFEGVQRHTLFRVVSPVA